MIMIMIMMDVGKVRMSMAKARMRVPVTVWITDRIHMGMGMLMVFVVAMAVNVLRGRMIMNMIVTLGEMQPHANSHQPARNHQLDIDRLPKTHQGYGGTDKRRCGKIGPGSCGSEMPQCKNE